MYTVQLNPAVFDSASSPFPAFLNAPVEARNKVRVPLDTMDGNPCNYEWSPKPVPLGPADSPIVRERRVLYIGLQPIQLIYSIVETGWTANSYLARLLAHYVDTGLIIVKKDGTVVTTAALIAFAKDN
jgi:hypothetical protein